LPASIPACAAIPRSTTANHHYLSAQNAPIQMDMAMGYAKWGTAQADSNAFCHRNKQKACTNSR